MSKKVLLGAALCVLASGAWAEQDAEPAHAEKYPTHEVVRFVNECMSMHGGRSWGNLYKCSCVIDYIASRMSYDEFSAADTYRRGQDISGERGDVLREPGKEGITLRQRIVRLEAKGRNQCGMETASSAGTYENGGDEDGD